MMKRKKWLQYAMAGALTLGAMTGVGFNAQAAMNTTTTPKWAERLDTATQDKVDAIMQQTQEKLAALGVEMPAKGPKQGPFANVDEETKAKAQAIFEQHKAGTLTQEEMQNQLAELGIDMPAKGPKQGPFANIDEETKAKAQAIFEQHKAGTLTQEEMQNQLAELGIDMPAKGPKQEPFANVDEETKVKAQAIIDDMKEQLDQLGVEMPMKGKGPRR